MKRLFCIVCTIALFLGLAGTVASTGPALDNIVDCYKLDQKTAGYDRDIYATIKPDVSVGQTFVTGDETITLCRIAIRAAVWSEEWSEDESLVLTVWDSPERKNRLGGFSMPHKWKLWEQGVIMFPVGNIAVKPNASYYFELTVDGGDGSIPGIFHASEDYSSGQRHEASKPTVGDLWFETHVKKPWNRDADYAYYFNHWNLDHPGLEKVKAAVTNKDWDTACREIVAFYENRKDLVQPRNPQKKAGYNAGYNELVLSMKIKDQNGVIWELGPDWNHYIQWPLRGGVGLTRTGIMKDLVGGYQNTTDEKYAKGFNEMVLCTRRDQPSPLRAGVYPPGAKGVNASPEKGIGGGSMWSALGLGARIGQLWYFYSGVVTSPNFSQDARCAMIFSMLDQMDVLAIMEGGGNWETQMADSLFEIGSTYPELKTSKEWFARGVSTLISNCLDTVHPDGVLREASVNYHGLVTNRFLQLLENAETFNIDIPPAMRRRVEKMIEHMMHQTEPMWFCPGTGDTFNYFDADDYFKRGAKFFNRPDFLWMLTRGKEGTKPLAASAAFKHGGWYTMRSGWEPDALFMNIHNGPNRGHGHHDSLQMVTSAYGSELLIDPGVYVYGTPETAKISRTTAHCTISVDGQDAHSGSSRTTWESNSTYDYFDGTNTGYNGMDDVKMRRRIAFIKPDYWVVVDEITGPGTHKLDSRFVCAAGKANVNGSTATFTDDKNGIVIASPASEKTSLSIDKGDWARYSKLEPVPVIKKSCETALPCTLVQAVVPFRGTKALRVKVESAKEPDGSIIVKVVFPESGRTDTVRFTTEGKLSVISNLTPLAPLP